MVAREKCERDRAALHCTRRPQVVVVLSFLKVVFNTAVQYVYIV